MMDDWMDERGWNGKLWPHGTPDYCYTNNPGGKLAGSGSVGLLGDPEVTANIYSNLPNTDTDDYSTDLR